MSNIDVHIEWFGPNGNLAAEESGIILGMQHIVHNVASRNVTFSYLTLSHHGLYTCQATAYLINSVETLTWTTQYHLEVASKLITKFHSLVLKWCLINSVPRQTLHHWA